MTIEKKLNDTSLTIAITGRLDTVTSPELETVLNQSLPGINHLTFDFANLEYISSAGLRVILGAQKVMSKQGTMNLIHVSDSIKEIFEMTGFSYILNIE